ncbi:hypothetical protein CSA56_14495 [candidate division KSB3 bacterium]|uniref:Uncharacterized protein n=1 Tax=candidate division KSB3 bacterium TaxID=2044937 RepID=A0A2G6KAJ5_9BACT|nr:MAG: hypothetical protein CSA56_14495 [candidate division KSB3 bacterium]
MATDILETQWYSPKASIPPSMKTWPRVLKSYEELPSEFRETLPKDDSTFPYTVFIPEERLSPFQAKRNAQTLCLYDDRLISLEAIQGDIVSTSYMLETITALEHGRVLLSSWLTINTLSQSKTFTFNTASEPAFRPIINAIRPMADNPNSAVFELQRQQEEAKLGYLWKENIKYFNYGKQSILPGETILESVYQPDIRISRLNFFKKPILHKYQTGHVTILTDKELIFIKESKATKKANETAYGALFTYIPLRQIYQINFEEDTKKSACFANITLNDNSRLRIQFSPDTAVNLESFKDACARTSAQNHSE